MNSKASDVSEGVEQRARELLAAEYEAALICDDGLAYLTEGAGCHDFAAIRAIAKALSPLPSPDKDLIRLVEILRRALVWHGDRARMATTREDWQQEVDEAINWVRDNPEDGRPSAPTIADPLPSLEVERLREALSGLVSFVSVMCGRGPDAIIPETIDTPLGIPIKIGAMMRDASAALSALPLDGGLSSD